MSFKLDKVIGTCHHSLEKPDCICFRDVVDDCHVSPWYEWVDLKNRGNISMKEFIEAVKDCNLSPEKLVLRAYEDGNGIVLDYGSRKQFWIPNTEGWDLEYLRNPIDSRVKDTEQLKPCPFCGGKAKIFVCQELRFGGDEGFVIQCTNCYMNTASINGTYSPCSEDIIKLWNRRSTN